MPESGTSGSVRGALRNERPYRERYNSCGRYSLQLMNIINIISRDLHLPPDSETKRIFEQRQGVTRYLPCQQSAKGAS